MTSKARRENIELIALYKAHLRSFGSAKPARFAVSPRCFYPIDASEYRRR